MWKDILLVLLGILTVIFGVLTVYYRYWLHKYVEHILDRTSTGAGVIGPQAQDMKCHGIIEDIGREVPK